MLGLFFVGLVRDSLNNEVLHSASFPGVGFRTIVVVVGKLFLDIL